MSRPHVETILRPYQRIPRSFSFELRSGCTLPSQRARKAACLVPPSSRLVVSAYFRSRTYEKEQATVFELLRDGAHPSSSACWLGDRDTLRTSTLQSIFVHEPKRGRAPSSSSPTEAACLRRRAQRAQEWHAPLPWAQQKVLTAILESGRGCGLRPRARDRERTSLFKRGSTLSSAFAQHIRSIQITFKEDGGHEDGARTKTVPPLNK